MPSSCIATVDPSVLDEQAGYVLLGIVNNIAYVHLTPYCEPQTVVFPNGDLTNPQPEGDGMQGIVECPRPSWAADAVILYDPTPDPFRWTAFAAAHPELADSPGDDPHGNPLPPPLMPHQWAGE
jgi:hypothetical protein